MQTSCSLFALIVEEEATTGRDLDKKQQPVVGATSAANSNSNLLISYTRGIGATCSVFASLPSRNGDLRSSTAEMQADRRSPAASFRRLCS